MTHVYLFLLIISFAVTLAAIPIIALAYVKTRTDYLKPYLAVIAIFSWNFLRLTVVDYFGISFNEFPYSLMSIPEPFLALVVPSFIHGLFSLKKKWLDRFFFVLCGLGVLLFSLYMVYGRAAEYLAGILKLIFAGVMVYTLVLSVLRWRHGKDAVLSSAWIYIAAVLASFTLAGLFFPDASEGLRILFSLAFRVSSIAFSLFNIVYFILQLSSFEESALDLLPEYVRSQSVSKRESEILGLILKGKSNKAISRELFISVPTVKSHVYSIFKKLAVSSRFELMRRVYETKVDKRGQADDLSRSEVE